MKTASRNIVTSILLGMATLLGTASWTTLVAQAPIPDMIDQKDNAGWGTFVSFKNGALMLKGSAGPLGWANIAEPTKVFHWDDAARDYAPASSAAEALAKVEAGTWVFVAANKASIRVGAAKEGHTTGTFVSFKNDKMLLLGKDLNANWIKKYGQQVHFTKFDENFPVFESIDGGDYTFAGTASTVLPKLKEGTLVTVYFGPNDGHYIRMMIGVKK